MSGTTTDRLGAITSTAEIELAALRERRRELALDAIVGDVQAKAEMASVSSQISELEDRLDLASLAAEREAERAQEAQQAAAEAERKRLEAEATRLAGERDAAIRGVQRKAIETGQATAQALRIDAELQGLNGQLGRPPRGISGIVGELVYVHVRDESGIEIEKVLNFRRQQLLAEFVLDDGAAVDDSAPDPGKSEQRRPGPVCSVCQHQDRAAIEAEIAEGATILDVAARHSLSKSALSRHRQHPAVREQHE